MKKYLFLILILFLAGFNLVKAAETDNITGYAWSENIGWISFNCKNSVSPIPCEVSNYGVKIDEISGNFSGYAWSENVGWISFEPNDTEIICGEKANLDLNTGLVSGFARALTADGDKDWDGCLKLRGLSQGGIPEEYGVSVDLKTGFFSGFGWSDNILGWTSFSHLNCDSDGDGLSEPNPSYPSCPIKQPVSEYQVKASFTPNDAPQAKMSCQIDECAGGGCVCDALNWETYNRDKDLTNAIYTILNQSFDPDGGSIAFSFWKLKDLGGIIIYEVDCSGACNYTLQSHPARDYIVELQVQDDKGKLSNKITHPIKIKKEAEAGFECALAYSENPDDWVGCENFKDEEPGTEIYLKDDLPDPHSNSEPSQDEISIIRRAWSLNDIVFSDENKSTTSITLENGKNEIKLETTDSQGEGGRTAAEVETIDIRVPSPVWREISIINFKEIIFSFFSKFLRA